MNARTDADALAPTDSTRRDWMLAGAASLVGLLGGGVRAASVPQAPAALPGFRPVPASRFDGVVVPPGYRAEVLYRWGDPVGIANAMPAFRPDASNSATEQALQAGMHHDGMHFFALAADGSRGLLVLNHEYIDESLLNAAAKGAYGPEQVKKGLRAMGVSVIEVERVPGGWRQVLPSVYARRIHGATPIAIAGPARGAPALRTAADPDGVLVLGTFANCAMGVTPWGTYLACEENFHGYFGGDANGAFKASSATRRYNLAPGRQWADFWRHDERFDLNRHPHEPNRFGWVVEIDPMDPQSVPVKRTALGRKAQESATCVSTRDGRLAVYMGDDTRFEYIYKFVSHQRVRPGGAAANRTLLDDGTLHVAQFTPDGRGRWLPLRHGEGPLTAANGFASQAEVLIQARLAAQAVGATPMDRPEWIAAHPKTGEMYATLTNNEQRGDAGKPGPDGGPNPRAANRAGQILRWREDGADAAATAFDWQLFAIAGDERGGTPDTRYPDAAADRFACPDGLHFDSGGLLWIQTDMGPRAMHRGEFEHLGNNALLCANVETGDIRRFLTGPRGAEITGCVLTPDCTTLFVNIQHPGEADDAGATQPVSAWPDGQTPGSALPRSATVVVRREDGGRVGT
jgi:secreted PhoX family phosphatase